MNDICIAKKVTNGSLQYLDFALDDNDSLLLFSSFKDASVFLKAEVGEGEQILDYIITTVEAHKDNPRMKELLSSAPAPQRPAAQPAPFVSKLKEETAPKEEPQAGPKVEIECTFLVEAADQDIINNEVFLDKKTGKYLSPAIVFIDPENPNEAVHTPHIVLKAVYVEKV